MIELVSIVCSLAVCILTPIEVMKIRNGWIRKKFGDDRAAFLQAYRKQLTLLTWLGFVFGILTFGLTFIETSRAEAIVKVVAAAIWFAVAVISLISQRALANVTSAE